MNALLSKWKVILYLFLSFVVVISYQNCGKSVFRIDSLGGTDSSSTLGVIDVACASASGCQSASSELTGGSSVGAAATGNGSQNGTSSIKLTNGMPSGLLHSSAFENANSERIAGIYLNYVADNKDGCELSIEQSLGKKESCQLGGGCGVDCGKPNSSTCESANPTLWGACILSE